MEFKDISKWFWDIAKYVVSAIIISSFLESYEDNTNALYVASILVAVGLMAVGTLFYALSKINNNKKK